MIKDEVRLRRLAVTDKKVIAGLCNNKKISDNLRDSFPFPYSEKDAENFIYRSLSENAEDTFGITYNGELAGVIGLIRQKDVYRLSAEMGYWIGEPYWGKGVATTAVKMIVEYAFERLPLLRIYAGVFDYNKASQKVLEKAGFKLDCIMEKAIIKNDVICDEYRYSIVKK
ncbi:MAG: GNAT family N-acetyltransferase [Bacteroidales bacterium]|nr:GNAT family N-acetyltransferase [Bacteroidales bacterium]